MNTLDLLCWALLLIASILALATVIRGAMLRAFELPSLERTLTGKSKNHRRSRQLLARALSDPATDMELAADFTEEIDSGARYINRFVIPFAPQAGLLGTCLGLAAAMSGLAKAGSKIDPAAALPGISTALWTTVAGLLVAAAALAADRLLMAPSLARVQTAARRACRAVRRKREERMAGRMMPLAAAAAGAAAAKAARENGGHSLPIRQSTGVVAALAAPAGACAERAEPDMAEDAKLKPELELEIYRLAPEKERPNAGTR